MWLKGVCLIDIPLFSFYWLQNETYCAGMAKTWRKNRKTSRKPRRFCCKFCCMEGKNKKELLVLWISFYGLSLLQNTIHGLMCKNIRYLTN